MLRYLGGKSKIAKHIAAAIGVPVDYEPFMGGGNMTAVLNPKDASDIDADVVGLFNAVRNGFEPPTIITEERYYWLKANEPHSPEAVFASFAASFSGKKWGGYARDPKSNRNYCAPIAKRLLLIRSLRTQFVCRSYLDLDPEPGSHIYCDPPYADTTGYAAGGFRSADFWDWVSHTACKCHLFISERSNPRDFPVLWQRMIPKTQSGATGKAELVTDSLMYAGPLLELL